ncbi:MAG: dihydropteroate synthase [Cyclobacteriaceae bacterium]|nr:dihydropteroate synthase [Flammeovirgaceae bacterium]
MQSKLFSVNKTLLVKSTLVDFSSPKVMGIVNVTPDSFFAGSRQEEAIAQLKQVEKMLTDGADFIDVGGYSSRPGAPEVPVEEELNRVIPAIQAIAKEFPSAILSVDTFRASVADRALDVGAAIVNDISAGDLDTTMIATVARWKAPYIAMHMRGNPQTMASLTKYDHLLKDIVFYFQEKLRLFAEAGIHDVIIDPGFGFAKTVEQNFELLNHLSYFRILERPVLAGLSRKSMIWRTLQTNSENALNGTTALHAVALLKGASILRVHDVKEAVETVKLLNKLL